MPYATGEEPQIGDELKCVRADGTSGEKAGLIKGRAYVASSGPHPFYRNCMTVHGSDVLVDSDRFELIRRAFDITKLDTSGVFDEAKPASEAKAVKHPRRAQHRSAFGNLHGYAQQDAPGDPWDSRDKNGKLLTKADWTCEAGERYIADGIWIETTDHHATAAQLPADGPQVVKQSPYNTGTGEIRPETRALYSADATAATEANDGTGVKPTEAMRKAAAEISCDTDVLWCQDIETIIARHVSPELAAAREEIAKLTKERDGWHGVVKDCERVVGIDGTADSPLLANVVNVVRDRVVEIAALKAEVSRLASERNTAYGILDPEHKHEGAELVELARIVAKERDKAVSMTLLDYFASKAMAAIISKLPLFDAEAKHGTPSSREETAVIYADVSDSAYRYAAAMLAVRDNNFTTTTKGPANE